MRRTAPWRVMRVIAERHPHTARVGPWFRSRWLHTLGITEQQITLSVLGLIDVVMISNLVVMVIVGGYETFVSRPNLRGHPDEPEWLSHVNASVLILSAIGIAHVERLNDRGEGKHRK
jgi:uncharacterized protein (TIGR00645 family)